MYVRKFEAETMEQALQEVKKELGPDAIILKTKTNKGLGGSFSKKKVEITAAISEKNYTNKSMTESSLNAEEKESFYQAPASHISNMIDNFSKSGSSINRVKNNPYGNIALNKTVQTVRNVKDRVRSSLDDFLEHEPEKPESMDFLEYENSSEPEEAINHNVNEAADTQRVIDKSSQNDALNNLQNEKIEFLEKKVLELSRKINDTVKNDPLGIVEMRTVLRGLSIEESYIQSLVRQSIFDLRDEQLEDFDSVFDFCLREMFKVINVDMPLFSVASDLGTEPITIILSETTSGQTSSLYKIAAMKPNCRIISYGAKEGSAFVKDIFGLDIERAETIAEVISFARKGISEGKAVFVDYKNNIKDINEAKNFVEGIKRSFDQVETLISLSGIHSEIYNQSIVSRYHSLANGIIVNMLDLCLDYGPLFNLSVKFPTLPYMFYSTGATIPEDIESATKERILSGMFKLK